MAFKNQIITINKDKYLLRRANCKVVLHHLPSLDVVYKYYAQVDFISVNNLQIMLIAKNVITFLKPKCPPLRLIEYQQEYLEWEPTGGVSMENMLILYDKATIVFYYRNPKLEKSWSIDIIQSIQSVKKSRNQLFLALKVKEPQNTIFIWDINSMSKKPNQQIILKEDIMKWSFFGKDILVILTKKQLKIYFVNEKSNKHYIQYYITLEKQYRSFVFLNDFNQTSIESGRHSVNTVALLESNSKQVCIVQLYDIQKRNKVFTYGQFKNIKYLPKQNQKENAQKIDINDIISGYQFQEKIVLMVQTLQMYPKSIMLDSDLKVSQIYEHKQHQGQNLSKIQCKQNYIAYFSNNDQQYTVGSFYKDKNFQQKIKVLKKFSKQILNIFLAQNLLLIVNQDKKLKIYNLSTLLKEGQLQFKQIQFGKFNPQFCHYIGQNQKGIYFVCGIRYFKYDIEKNEIVNLGFVMKNQRAKLFQARNATSSLIYKINNQHILMEYEINQKSQKLVFRTVKSTQQNKLISLRKGRWAEMGLREIILGQQDKQLARFNLQKMYKSLMQENSYYEYDLYWITHNGIAMTIKNYLFFLQIMQSQNGFELRLIKKGHSYLYRRFSSKISNNNVLKIIDPRNLVIYTGNRIVKLQSQIQHLITENPFQLSDTLLNRQLQMRQYYPPHHPKIILGLIETSRYIQVGNIMNKVKQWYKEGKTLRELYQSISIEDYYSKQDQIIQKDQFGQELIKIKEQRTKEEQIQLYKYLCQEIINEPAKFSLTQNSPLVLENILCSIIFKVENSTAMDYFSQSVITKQKMHLNKDKPFTTLDVAFLYHSINKQQAIEFLKPKQAQIDWNWFQKYSVILWYNDNPTQLNKWIEQIAMFQFRKNKDPFDCLFWYIMANKKSLLITLFKAQKFSSKQHEAMHTFLQRDFNEPKHKSAAVKNAYALIDKKRYMHALAFFLLSDKIEECIRFTIDRLKDLNLAFLIYLQFKQTITVGKKEQVYIQNFIAKQLIQKGDVWAKHIGWNLVKKPITAHNVLLKERINNNDKWDFIPQLRGFHPSLSQFSQKIKNTISYKREIQAKINPVSVVKQNYSHLQFSMDSFSDNFSADTTSKTQQEQKIKQPEYYMEYEQLFEVMTEEEQSTYLQILNTKSVKFYSRQHLHCLALAVPLKDFELGQRQIKYQSRRAYQLQKYRLTGQINESVLEIAQGIYDIIGILKNDIIKGSHENLLRNLKQFRGRFELSLKKIKINQINPPLKHQKGQILHYTYLSEEMFKDIFPIAQKSEQLQKQIQQLTKTNNLGKIIIGISLNFYLEMSKFLTAYKQHKFVEASQQFWQTARQKYDYLIQSKKQKHQKLMDCFQLSLNKHIKKKKDQDHLSFQMSLPKSSVTNVLIFRKIFQYLFQNQQYLAEQLKTLKFRLDKVVKYWASKQYIEEIRTQIETLINEGFQVRLKLNVLPQEFGETLHNLYEVIKTVYTFKNPQDKVLKLVESQTNSEGQKIAMQIFKNKSQHVRNFALNKNQGQGLQIMILFKKGMKKIQVCDSIINKDRHKGGNQLIHEDSIYTAIQQVDFNKIVNTYHRPLTQVTFENILHSRKLYDTSDVVRKSAKMNSCLEQYLKELQPIPPIDHNQINCIEQHAYLPLFLLGGKSIIQVCRFSTMKNFNRIACPGLQDIIKLSSIGQRVCALDGNGNFNIYGFDSKYVNKSLFDIKKQGIIDFSCISPSILTYINNNSVQLVDTLLHPKRQNLFKIQMNVPPVAVSHLKDHKIIVLRKHEVQIYDTRMDYLEQTLNIDGRGRSLLVDKDKEKIMVGRNDCKIKIFDLAQKEDSIVKVGQAHDDKDKIYIESLKMFRDSYFCFRNDGSIYHFEN